MLNANYGRALVIRRKRRGGGRGGSGGGWSARQSGGCGGLGGRGGSGSWRGGRGAQHAGRCPRPAGHKVGNGSVTAEEYADIRVHRRCKCIDSLYTNHGIRMGIHAL